MRRGALSLAAVLLFSAVEVGPAAATVDLGEVPCEETHTNYTFDNPWPLPDQDVHGDSYPGNGYTTAGQHQVTEEEHHTEFYSGFSEDEHEGCEGDGDGDGGGGGLET